MLKVRRFKDLFTVTFIIFLLVLVSSCEEEVANEASVPNSPDDCIDCGCTDNSAVNYDPLAVTDDGTCQYYNGELNIIWSKEIDQAGEMWSMRPVSDGGFILVGSTLKNGESDIYLVKTDSDGNQEW